MHGNRVSVIFLNCFVKKTQKMHRMLKYNTRKRKEFMRWRKRIKSRLLAMLEFI